MEAQSRDQACAPQPGGEDVLNVLSPTAQVKNRGDTSRVLSVLSKTKVWSVLDLSRNKNQVLEFYNKVLKKKKKSGLLPAATLTTFQHKSTLKIT